MVSVYLAKQLEVIKIIGKIKEILLICTILIFGLIGCSKEKIESDEINIVTTLFPQYDFAREIVGDKAQVSMLLPVGVESHAFEPTPADIIKIQDAEVFIYSNKYIEPWVENILENVDKSKIVIIDMSENITLLKSEEHEDEENHEKETFHELEPHVWTDPINSKTIVSTIAAGIAEADAANKDFYLSNAESYNLKLDELNSLFENVVEQGKRKVMYFGGRFPYFYFTKRYGLLHESAFESCSTESEPSVKTVARLIDEIKENKIPVIYYEELLEPKVAKSISNETGAKMVLFHSCHNVTKDQFDSGVTYLELMNNNILALEEGLN